MISNSIMVRCSINLDNREEKIRVRHKGQKYLIFLKMAAFR